MISRAQRKGHHPPRLRGFVSRHQDFEDSNAVGDGAFGFPVLLDTVDKQALIGTNPEKFGHIPLRARAKQHAGITDLTLPGVLKDFDLPDIVGATTPCAVFLASPRLPTGGSMAAPEAAKAYRSSSVRVLDRAQGWTFDMVYKGW